MQRLSSPFLAVLTTWGLPLPIDERTTSTFLRSSTPQAAPLPLPAFPAPAPPPPSSSSSSSDASYSSPLSEEGPRRTGLAPSASL